MNAGSGSVGLGALVALSLLVGLAGGFLLARGARRRRDEQFRETQTALRASEDRLRRALEASHEIVWDWDLVKDDIYHPSWAQAYGFPEERTPRTAKGLLPFVHPDDVPGFLEAVRRATEGPQDTMEIEHRALTGSGEWKWMLLRARILARDGAGRGIRAVGTCTDVTEQKQMLARLQIADRMASIGTLAAGVAHEINNPLTYVVGNLDFSLQRLGELPVDGAAAGPPAGEAIRECIDALRDARSGAQRMRDIVRDLKVFTRGDEDDGHRPVQLARLLRAALSLADNEIRHRARVALDVADVPPVRANESRLSQVFLNLLVNAAQAIPDGHADRNEIRVTARRGAADRAVVEVRDTGCGITAEHRKRLFDPFFTTKPVGMGTGLGLSICHGIVAALGGEIEVESEPGKGSTFRVILPLWAGESAVEQAQPPPAAPPPRRARVLIVDDEPLFCRMVERVLAEDHEVVALADAREALRRVRGGERYDVVVSDLAMPVISGMELHDEISRVDPLLATRMLFVTGGVFTPLAADFVARFEGRVLDKPVAADALRAAIAEVLAAGPGASAAAGARRSGGSPSRRAPPHLERS